MMACAQLGITLCGVLLGALGEPAVAALLEPVFHALGVPEGWLHPVSLVIALLLVVSAHVALGEMVPKNIAIAGPERTALALAPAAAGDRQGHRADHPDAEPFRQCRRPADRPGTQGRGGVRLHPGGGRRPGGRVPAGGTAGRRGTPADHLGAGLRHHRRRRGDGARRRGDVRRTRGHRGRDRADLRPNRVLPVPDPRTGRPVLRLPAHPGRRRHPGRPAGRAGPARQDPARCRRWPRTPTCAPRWTGCAGSVRTWPRSPYRSAAAAGEPATGCRSVDPIDRAPVAVGPRGRDARGRHRGADRGDPGRHPPVARSGRPACGRRRGPDRRAARRRLLSGPCSGGSWGSKPSSVSPARFTGSDG